MLFLLFAMLSGGTGLEGNARGNPVMGHDDLVGQAPDQANEGDQAGASNAEDKSLARHAHGTVGISESHSASLHQPGSLARRHGGYSQDQCSRHDIPPAVRGDLTDQQGHDLDLELKTLK
jgi:hypothetical protein